jgi:hypothetical protein
MKRMMNDNSYKNTRKPMAHNSYWNENDQDNIVPEERAVLAGTVMMVNLQNYDTVINQKQAGYRNNGVFIYYNNGLHPLSTLKEAEKLVNDSLKTYFKKEKYVYFDANVPCLFNEENLLYDDLMFQKVIQLTTNTT